MNNLNKFCYVTILFLLIISSLQAENISGIINIYKPVIAFDYCENSVTITNSDSLKIGDKVLMIQMQGAIIDTTNTIQFGDLLDIRSSGLYEFGIIEKIVGNFITFKNVIINKYNIDGNIQIIKVPQYKVAKINNEVTAQNWNGKTGGVLIFEADSIIMYANIDAAGKGFRGGLIKEGTSRVNNSNYVVPENNSTCSRKGEGITVLRSSLNSGMGKYANGGGGGNSHNSGGGGGGNLSSGGHGGYSISTLGLNNNIGGIGGIKIPINNLQSRVILGGGGGAGDGNNNVNTSGTNGGGIIFINSNTIIGNNFKINASGLDAFEAGNDGAGGGGAGGSILINCNYIENCNIYAIGGNGGNNSNGLDEPSCHGPGGGGGGGLILSNIKLNKNTKFNIQLGHKGVITLKTSICGYLSNYGATDGGNGLVDNSNTFTFVTQNKPFKVINDIYTINNNIKNIYACNVDSVKLIILPKDSLLSYIWSNGKFGNEVFANKSGNYSCTITNDACNFVLTCNVNLLPKTIFKINKTDFFNNCTLDSVKLAVTPFTDRFTYLWTTKDTNQSIVTNKSGLYKIYIKSKDTNYTCIDSIEYNLDLNSIGSTSGFTYSAFNDTNYITLLGDVKEIDKSLKLTNANFFNRSAVWNKKKVKIDGGFVAEYSFILKNGNNHESFDGSLPGADGLALVFQNNSINELGGTGGGIGYGGIKNGIAFELDLFKNEVDYHDFNGNHFAMQYSSNSDLSPDHKSNSVLNNKIPVIVQDKEYFIKIDYSQKNYTIKVLLDTVNPPKYVVLDTIGFDFRKILQTNDGYSFVGITSATGVAFQEHYLDTWSFCEKNESGTLGIEDDNQSLSNDSFFNEEFEEIFIYDELGTVVNHFINSTLFENKNKLLKHKPLFIFVKKEHQVYSIRIIID